MTEEVIVIKIEKATHPALFNEINERMKDFGCKTYPELLGIMFDRASLKRRIAREMKVTLIELGILVDRD